MNLSNILDYHSKRLEDTQINSNTLTEFVANSLRVVVEEFFMQMAPSFAIVVSSRNITRYNFFLNVLQYLFSMVHYMNIQLVFINREKPQRVKGQRLHNLLLVDSYESFLDIDIISYTKRYDTNEYYYIFLMQKDRLRDYDMQRIFAYCWTNQIINCNIEFQNKQGELHLYTYFPYVRDKCENTQPELVNQFVGDKWLKQQYFLPKLNNFHGCPLVGAVRHIPPFTSVKNDTERAFNGIEIEMIKEMARILKFTLILRPTLKDDRLTTEKGDGFVKLDDRTAHFAFGYYRKRALQSREYTTTAPHYQSSVISVINVRAHLFNTFQVLTYPFPNFTWIIILVCSLLVLAITRLARWCEPKSMRAFSMVACTFGIPIREMPQYGYSFSIFTPWLWCTFLLRSVYSALLYHFFRNDIYQPLPSSLYEALNQSYISVMNQYTYNDVQDITLYNHNTRVGPLPIVLNSSNEMIGLEYLEQHLDRNLLAVVAQEFLMYYTVVHRNLGTFYTIPDALMQQQLCLYLTKHSFLINQFDSTIMNLKSVGLLKFWMNRYLDRNVLSNVNLDTDKMIKQNDLLGLYMVCGAFYLIALIIFIVELLSVKVKKLRFFFE